MNDYLLRSSHLRPLSGGVNDPVDFSSSQGHHEAALRADIHYDGPSHHTPNGAPCHCELIFTHNTSNIRYVGFPHPEQF